MFVGSRVCFLLSENIKSNHGVIGYPPKSDIPSAPLDTSCLMSHCCSRHRLQLSKITDEFSLSAAHIVPSSDIKEPQQGGSFQFTSSKFSWCPTTQMCGVSRRVLSLNSIKGNGNILFLSGGHWELDPKSPRECYPRYTNGVLV